MPIYLYGCKWCKDIIEKIQPINGEPPECCGEPMIKLPTAQAFIKMKGEGGYPSLRKSRQRSYGTNLQEDDKKRKAWV